jgi:ligand-binding sensor domain-containing protein
LEAGWEVFTNKNTVRGILVDTEQSRTFLSSNGGLVEISATPDTVITYMTTLQGLAANDLNCLDMDSAGNVFMGTSSKGMVTLFTDGQVRNYSTFDGLPSDEVLCIVAGDEDFWIGTTRGAVRMELEDKDVNRKSPIYFGEPLDYEVRSFYLDGTKVWFATSDGLWLLEDDELQSWLLGQGLADNSVRVILPAGGDSLLIATDSGIQIFLPDSGMFHDFSEGLVSDDSRNIRGLTSLDGEFWAATEGGVYRYNADTGNWVDETLDLPTRMVLTVAVDLSGALMVGTDGEGIALRGSGGWSGLKFPGPLVNSLNKVVVDEKGVVWASSWSVSNSRAGIFRYDGSSIQNYTTRNSDLLYNLASSLNIAPDGAVWLGSPWFSEGGSGLSILYDGGTAVLEDDTWITMRGIETGLSGDAMRNSVVFKEDGEAWVGSWNEPDQGLPGGLDVLKYNGGEFTFRSFGQLVEGRRIQALAIDPRGDLWIGYSSTGVDAFILRPATSEGDSLFFSIDPDGVFLAGETINDLELDPLGHLWICTASGVTELDYAGDALNSSEFKWRSFSMDNSSFPDIQANAVSFQGARFVWFATPSGAAKYDRELDTWQIFNSSNSPMPDDDVNDVFVDGNSSAVWFATEAGLVKFYHIGDEPTVHESGNIIVAPNPFLPGKNPQGVLLGRFDPGTTLNIFSVSGRRIAKLVTQSETIRWDGKSESGEEVGSGVYLIVSRSPAGVIGRGKIAIVR